MKPIIKGLLDTFKGFTTLSFSPAAFIGAVLYPPAALPLICLGGLSLPASAYFGSRYVNQGVKEISNARKGISTASDGHIVYETTSAQPAQPKNFLKSLKNVFTSAGKSKSALSEMLDNVEEKLGGPYLQGSVTKVTLHTKDSTYKTQKQIAAEAAATNFRVIPQKEDTATKIRVSFHNEGDTYQSQKQKNASAATFEAAKVKAAQPAQKEKAQSPSYFRNMFIHLFYGKRIASQHDGNYTPGKKPVRSMTNYVPGQKGLLNTPKAGR